MLKISDVIKGIDKQPNTRITVARCKAVYMHERTKRKRIDKNERQRSDKEKMLTLQQRKLLNEKIEEIKKVSCWMKR